MDSPDPRLPVTLRDVAREIGVSHVTVSLALRGNPQIPEARRTQIQQAATRLGYRPDAVAAALALHKQTGAVAPIRAALAWLNRWPQHGDLRGFAEFDRYWRGAFAAAEKFGYRLEEFVCDRKMPLPRLEKVLLARGGAASCGRRTRWEWNGRGSTGKISRPCVSAVRSPLRACASPRATRWPTRSWRSARCAGAATSGSRAARPAARRAAP